MEAQGGAIEKSGSGERQQGRGDMAVCLTLDPTTIEEVLFFSFSERGREGERAVPKAKRKERGGGVHGFRAKDQCYQPLRV
jgi:hypothetical protein